MACRVPSDELALNEYCISEQTRANRRETVLMFRLAGLPEINFTSQSALVFSLSFFVFKNPGGGSPSPHDLTII